MLTAINSQTLLKVNAISLKKIKGDIFHCESCKGEVIFRKGLIKINHFYHKIKCNCQNSGESEEHLTTKSEIFDFVSTKWGKSCKIIELEKSMFNKLRPDIYIETIKGNKIGIEIQVSQLTPSEIIRRTKLYKEHNMYVLWVLLLEKSRFYLHNTFLGHKSNKKEERIKLKEFEIDLYTMFYKRLCFWDLENDFEEGFIIVTLEDSYGDDSEFYDVESKEVVSMRGRRLKTIKKVMNVVYGIDLDKFKLSKGKEFTIMNRNYSVPERHILTINEEKVSTKTNLFQYKKIFFCDEDDD
jgi:Competence protein CoiA-like family